MSAVANDVERVADRRSLERAHGLDDRCQPIGGDGVPVVDRLPPDHGVNPVAVFSGPPHLLADEPGLLLEEPAPVQFLDTQPLLDLVRRYREGEEFDDHAPTLRDAARPDRS